MPGPRVYLESVRRGFDDGNPRSCSNAGVLTLVIDPRDVSPTDVYSFETASGRVPDGLLPRGFAEPVELGDGQFGFRFYWHDLRAGGSELEPIAAVVRIRRVSFAGDRSEPMLLEIVEPGGAAASAGRRSNSIVIWAGVAVVLIAFFAMRTKARGRRSSRTAELEAIRARLRQLAAEQAARRRGDEPPERPAD